MEPFLRLMRIMESSAFIKAGSSVCDIGCGKNYVFLKSVKNKISRGVGLDKEVENGEEGNIRLISADIEGRLPELGKFDHVTMLAVLEHMSSPEKMLKACRNMLAENGTIIITTPSRKSRKKLEFLARTGFVSRKEISDHKHYFAREELEGAMKSAGFEIIKIKTFEFGNNILAVGRKA